MQGWLLVVLIVSSLGGSALGHCDCHDEEHGSFSLEFSEEVSLSGDLSDLPFIIHHHDHPGDHHHHHHHDHDHDHHDLSDLFSSELFDSDEHHESFHEEISEELELEIDHEHSHEHHDHHDHHDSDFSPDIDDLLFYYRK